MKNPTPNQQPIDVSAALIFHKGRLLITQRHAGSHLGGLWEFPGGKREPNETFEQSLVREINEELGMTITVGKLFDEITHAYREKKVHLKFFLCEWTAGEPQTLDCASFKWVAKDELAGHAFPAADAQLLEKISRNWPEGGSGKS
ncbi:MAG TPA: 8-oxo-dGTP diphosphatase MutT [Alphaproteobacteria bacterium]|nr:8-oxo-dGTP diphosphatase MutT [Alphaproteobacteria bacterium]